MNDQRLCSNGIILNSTNEFLLVKRSLEDSAFPGEWELPGGGIDYGETMNESLKREMKEEVGLVIEVL